MRLCQYGFMLFFYYYYYYAWRNFYIPYNDNNKGEMLDFSGGQQIMLSSFTYGCYGSYGSMWYTDYGKEFLNE